MRPGKPVEVVIPQSVKGGYHPKDLNFKRLSKTRVMISRLRAQWRNKFNRKDQKVFENNRAHRLAKYVRDRRAALMNPAWIGQPWVEARYGWDPEDALKSRFGK